MSNLHWSPYLQRMIQYNGNGVGQTRPFLRYDLDVHNTNVSFAMQDSLMSAAVQNSPCEYNITTTYGAMANEAVNLFMEVVTVSPLPTLLTNRVLTQEVRPKVYAKKIVLGPCAILAIMVACGWDYTFPINKCSPEDFRRSTELKDNNLYREIILPMMEYMARKCNIYPDYRFTVDEVDVTNGRTWQDVIKRRMRSYGLWDNEFVQGNLSSADKRMLKGVNIYHTATIAKFVPGINDNMQTYNKNLLFITDEQKLPRWWENSTNGRKYQR